MQQKCLKSLIFMEVFCVVLDTSLIQSTEVFLSEGVVSLVGAEAWVW